MVAARFDGRTVLDALLNEGNDFIARGCVDDRPDIGFGVRRVADNEFDRAVWLMASM